MKAAPLCGPLDPSAIRPPRPRHSIYQPLLALKTTKPHQASAAQFSGQMTSNPLRCVKDGRLFFSQQEASDHAEAFGSEYANFEEVPLDSKVWVCVETKRPAYTEAEMQRIKQRDPNSQTWEEKTVQYLIELQKQRDEASRKKDRFFDSVDPKKLQALTEVKLHNRVRAAKALHFTKERNTLEAAEAWIAQHAEDRDVDKLTDEFLDNISSAAAGSSSAGGGDVTMGNAEDVEMTPAVDDRQPGDPNPEEIKSAVNQEMLKELLDMGFSELRGEKALYKTDNAGLEHAIGWLTDHANDADIDLPLLKPAPAAPERPKMSKEEAEAKAMELQRKLRQKKAEEEKLSEKERERMRIESTKMMVEANEKLKEEERLRAMQQQQREKEEHERHRAELKERLRQDYIERFGREPPAEEEIVEGSIKEKSSKDQLIHFLNKLKKTYKDSNPDGLKTCLATLKVYISNLQANPAELKFKKIKLDNKGFQGKILPFEGAVDVLDVLGFERKEDCLEQRKTVPDGWLCGQAIKFIDLMLGQI